jgi:hypothetical protein
MTLMDSYTRQMCQTGGDTYKNQGKREEGRCQQSPDKRDKRCLVFMHLFCSLSLLFYDFLTYLPITRMFHLFLFLISFMMLFIVSYTTSWHAGAKGLGPRPPEEGDSVRTTAHHPCHPHALPTHVLNSAC